MATLHYSYKIDTSLKNLRNELITKEMWEIEGSPCIYVEFDSPVSNGFFVIHLPDLEGFAERKVDIYDNNDILDIFDDMLSTENYVENVFLPQSCEIRR